MYHVSSRIHTAEYRYLYLSCEHPVDLDSRGTVLTDCALLVVLKERQRLQRCLLHTLNNLLQQQAWTVQSLNELCDSIQATRTRLLGNYDANVLAAALEKHGLEVKWHDARDTQLTTLDLTHHNTGTDTQQSGAQEVPPQQQHHQQQQQAYSEDQVEHLTLSERQTNDFQQQQAQQDKEQQQQQELQQELVGLIVNMSGRGWLSSLLGGRHWLAIRWLKGAWWNLDSQLSQPVSFALEELDMGSTAAAAAAAAAATLDASEAAASSIADSTAPAAVPAVTAALSAGDGGAAALKAFLQQQLSSGAHLLLVTRAAAQHDKQWACSS